MKRHLMLWGVLTIVGILAACSQKKSTEIGNGGDPLHLEWARRAYFVGIQLGKRNGDGILTLKEVDQLMDAINTAQVELTDESLVDMHGTSVAAVTSPHPSSSGRSLIRVNRERWRDAVVERISANKLVFHEYLWAMGKDDSDYKLSRMLGLSEEDYDIFKKGFQKSGCGADADDVRVATFTPPTSHGLLFFADQSKAGSVTPVTAPEIYNRALGACRHLCYNHAKYMHSKRVTVSPAELMVVDKNGIGVAFHFSDPNLKQYYIDVLECRP